MKRCITQAKRTEERSWLGEVSASMLQQSVRDLSQAFRNWWQGQGRVRAPNFKKRGNRQGIRACGKEFYPTDTGVRFPKIGVLRLRWSRPLPSEPSSVTIIKECSGKYYASFVVEVADGKLPPPRRRLGLIWAWHPSPSPLMAKSSPLLGSSALGPRNSGGCNEA